MEDWTNCLESIEIIHHPEDRASLTQAMQCVIDVSWPLCNPTSISRAKQGCDLEVEAEKEKEILAVVEKLEEDVCFNPLLKEIPHRPLSRQMLLAFSQGKAGFDMEDLNRRCNILIKNNACMAFSSKLFASKNYSKVYEGQEDMLGFYLKPVHAILFRMDNNTITACIVSNQEAEEIKALLDINLHNIWLGNTQHTCLAGKCPDTILNKPEYHILIEQIRFFNGECNTLIEQETPFFWLNENTNNKLAYFEKNIMPYRESKDSELRILRSIMSNNEAGFNYIKQHPFDDLNNVDWGSMFPDLSSADIATLEILASAFEKANQLFQIEPLSLDWFRNNYLLPPVALPFLQYHLALLNDFEAVLGNIQDATVTPYNLVLDELSSTQNNTLEKVFSFDINAMMKRHKLYNNKTDNVSRQLYNLDLLMIVRSSHLVNKQSFLDALVKHNPLINYATIELVNSENVLIALLNNTSDLITVEHFERFQTYPQTLETLTLQLHHRHLTLTNIHFLMKSFPGKIEFVLDEIEKNTYFKPSELANLLAIIITQYDIDNMSVLAKKHLKLISAYTQEDVLVGILNKDNCTEVTYQAILNYFNPSVTVIHMIMKVAHSQETWIAILNQPNTTQDIYMGLLETHHLDDKTLQVLLSKTIQPELLMLVAKQKELGVDVIQAIVLKAANEQILDVLVNEHVNINDGVLRIMVHHSFVEIGLLTTITKKAVDSETFIAVLNHPNINNRITPELVGIILSKPTVGFLEERVLKKLAEKTQDEKQLEQIITINFTEPVIDTILKHQNLSQNFFEIILNTGKVSEEVLSKLALRISTREGYRRLIQQANISDAILRTLINKQSFLDALVKHNPLIKVNSENVLIALLNNTSDLITVEHFERFQTYPQTLATLTLQLHHRHLTLTNIHFLMKSFPGKIEFVLDEIEKNTHLKPSELANLLAIIITQYGIDNMSVLAKKHLKLISSYPQEDVLVGILNKDNCTEETHQAILNYFNPSVTVIHMIMKTAHSQETWIAILNQPNATQDIYMGLLETHHLDDKTLQVLLSKTIQPELLMLVAKQKELGVDVIQAIVLKAANEQILDVLVNEQVNINDGVFRSMVQHSFVEIGLLTTITKKAVDSETFIAVLNHPNINNRFTPELVGIILSKPTEGFLEERVLKKLAEKTQDEKQLELIITINCTEPVIDTILKHQNLSQNFFETILNTGQVSEEVLSKLALRISTREGYRRLIQQANISDATLRTLINKRSFSVDMLPLIVSKAKDISTFKLILKKAVKPLDEHLLTLVFNHTKLAQDEGLLTALAMQTQNEELLKQIIEIKSSMLNMERKLKKQPNLSESVLVEMLKHPGLNPPILIELSSRITSDEAIRYLLEQENVNDDILKIIMSRNNHISAESIDSIIDKARDPKTLSAAINQSNATEHHLYAIGISQYADNTIFHALINSQSPKCFSLDMWIKIVEYHIADQTREKDFIKNISKHNPSLNKELAELDALLAKLYVRAHELIIKSIKKKNTACANEAKDALSLYILIIKMTQANENGDVKIEELKNTLDEYKPKFKDSTLVQIYNAIVLFFENCVHFVWPSSTYKARLYETKKETSVLVDEIGKNCTKMTGS